MDTDEPKNPPSKNNSRVLQGPWQKERQIAELIARLLSHYWTADDDPAIRELQADDWIEDLAEFSVEVVAEACREWRQNHTKRPSPAQLRDLAVQETGWRQRQTERLLPRKAMTCEEQWGSCSNRWHARGFICRVECRNRIPDYRTLTDEEAEAMLGPRARRTP